MATYTIQPDATAGKDAHIRSDNPTNNYGSNTGLGVGDSNSTATLYRALIQFDLSGIGATETCTSAVQSLYRGTDQSSNARAMRCYRILQAWAQLGVTWNNRDNLNAWGTAGCAGAGDRESTDIGSYSSTGTEGADQECQFSLTPSKIQELYNGTMTNNGWLIQADTETDDCLIFRSSNYGTDITKRPKLVVVTTTTSGLTKQYEFYARLRA